MDVARLPYEQKTVVLRALEGPWTIGRLQQQLLFQRLVPDDAHRACISRNHLELSWDVSGHSLRLRKLSNNALVVDGQLFPGGQSSTQEAAVRDGAEIGFCGTSTVAKVLVFRVSLSSAVKADRGVPGTPDSPERRTLFNLPEADGGRPGPPDCPQRGTILPEAGPGRPTLLSPQRDGGPAISPVTHALVCTLATGTGVTALPHGARRLELRSDGPLTVGRMHQRGFFEGLLGAAGAHDYISLVSRSHFEVAPVAEAPGSFEVTNLSANPFVVHYRHVGHAERTTLRVGDSMDFIASGPGGSEVVFLKFRLESIAGAQDAEALGLHAGSDPPGTDPNMSLWPSSPGSPAAGAPEFRLVATQAYQSDVMALSPRARIISIPVDGRLTLGRQHQLGFFEGLLEDRPSGESLLCRISRSHLELAPSPGEPPGCYMVTNISYNPVVVCDWSQDEGPREQQLDQGGCAVLRPGDSLDFVAARPDGQPGAAVVYLQLCLEPALGALAAPKVRPAPRGRTPRRRRGDWAICA